MTRATSEKSFQSAVVDLAHLLRWRVFYVRDSRGSPGGWPDLVLLRGEIALFRELKVASGRLSPDQHAWGDALTAAGLDYGVWREGDWDSIAAQLRGQLELDGAA
jgi:VRR-NUC domain